MNPERQATALTALSGSAALSGDQLKACCAAAYGDPAVRWLLGDQLHPGGPAATRQVLELAHLCRGELLLDVASGSGTSALLAASEFGADAVGVEYGEAAVLEAREEARRAGLGERVSFVRGDAEALPLDDASVDLVLCECSLCTFPDKQRAVAEIRRVLRPGGRLALADVVVEPGSLPPQLRGALGAAACVAEALSLAGYEDLLGEAGLTVTATDGRERDAAHFARGIEERLRGARLLGIEPPPGAPLGLREAIDAVRSAREAIAAGTLGYALLVAER